jgi:hypothetical protein
VQHLVLRGTPITDTGLKGLRELKSLVTLDVTRTKVTRTGIKDFDFRTIITYESTPGR